MSRNDIHQQIIAQKLEEKKASGLYRSLDLYHEHIDFASNDYLGLARLLHSRSNVENDFGSTGSRLISGNSVMAEETEQIVADHHLAKSGLIYSTGYMANLGLLSCIASRHDTFIYDEYCHASMIDGMRLSLAKKVKFKHNNVDDLESKLAHTKGVKWVVTESIFSMDGDQAPLAQMLELTQRYQAALIVDEAHSSGIIGANGIGLVADLGLENEVFARIHTFGKALGCHGAIILGSHILREYLINYSRSFIYSTAPAPQFFQDIQLAYDHISQADRNQLMENIAIFKECAQIHDSIKVINSDSPIQGILIPGNEQVIHLSQHLLNNNIFAKAIRSPTVPKDLERIRICLHSYNTEQEIRLLFELLENITM